MNTTADASILVVEDNADLNFALGEILRSYGYQVESAYNGFEALDRLRARAQPNVILCDIMMPGMDGYTLLQHTRADVNLRTLPFIFLTARASTEDQRRAKEIGIDDYLTKPIDSRDLVLAIENALLRSRLAAEETRRKMDSLRNRIVGILQHEFRTPLTFVLGYAELLATTDAASFDLDDLRQWSAAILDGGRRLQRLIEGFLLLAELQNQTLAPTDLETLSAWTLWAELGNDFRGEAEDAALSFELSPQNQDVSVRADAHLLGEALRRLIDNAIRYRRPESRRIRLSVERLSAYVGLRIADEGMGIPADRLADFGQPFEQPGREQRTTSGAGLSLALIKDIAHLHGGSLEIDSTYGVGSTFTLWLPSALTEMEPGAG